MDAPIEHPALCGCADCDARYEGRALREPEPADRFAGDHRCAPQGPTREVLLARRGLTHHDVADRESELALRYQAGDRHAGEILLRAHAKLIAYYGMKYGKTIKHDLEPEEVISIAQVGFLEAVRRFEPERGYKLVTYGQHWIRSYVREQIVDTGKLIRVPSYHFDSRTTGKRRYEQEAHAATNVSSLDVPLVEGSEFTLADTLEDGDLSADERIMLLTEQKSVDGLVDRARLNEVERAIVERRILADEEAKETLREIGDSFHLSRERIRQLEVSAIERLRRAYAKGKDSDAPALPPDPPAPPAEKTACQRCGHEGHGTKTCERWGGRKLGTWVVERVGMPHYSAGGTMSTQLVLRCSLCKLQTNERATHFDQRRTKPCTCTVKKVEPPPPAKVAKKKLPVVVEQLVLSAPLPVSRITKPTDRFRCAPYEAVLFANACVKRQEMLSQERASRVLEYSKCKGCRTGQEVQKRLGVDVAS